MFHISFESTFGMVKRRFAPWRLYSSAECASLPMLHTKFRGNRPTGSGDSSLPEGRRQAKHFFLAKQFCFLDADSQVAVGESQGTSRRSVGKYPVKPPRHYYLPKRLHIKFQLDRPSGFRDL